MPASKSSHPFVGEAPSGTSASIEAYTYLWPRADSLQQPPWRAGGPDRFLVRQLPEDPGDVRRDSRWPGFFPSPICIITTAADGVACLEKVVGPSIVNRFPYVCALSLCREDLSERHHPRRRFMEVMEKGGEVAIQFLPPGPVLDRVMRVISEVPEDRSHERLGETGLATRPGRAAAVPVFEDAYLVYEGRLVRPKRDFSRRRTFETPHRDVGSHRVYFVEIDAIQLDRDIAVGRRQIKWFSLPRWSPDPAVRLADGAGVAAPAGDTETILEGLRYQKGYRADYRFPARDTVAFEFDDVIDEMAVKHLSPLPEDQVEVDNDRARWPCFFPSSAGLITTRTEAGVATCMPCGSTTVISRHPMVIAPCISYSAINERYAPRATLGNLTRGVRFGCGVPFAGDDVLKAICYLGNVSFAVDPAKIAHSGLTVLDGGETPILAELPIHYDCRVIDRIHLGTHIMFLGEVERIHVRPDLTPANPLAWCPWPMLSDGAV